MSYRKSESKPALRGKRKAKCQRPRHGTLILKGRCWRILDLETPGQNRKLPNVAQTGPDGKVRKSFIGWASGKETEMTEGEEILRGGT